MGHLPLTLLCAAICEHPSQVSGLQGEVEAEAERYKAATKELETTKERVLQVLASVSIGVLGYLLTPSYLTPSYPEYSLMRTLRC